MSQERKQALLPRCRRGKGVRAYVHPYGTSKFAITGERNNQNQLSLINIGRYVAFGSILGSDYYVAPQ